MPTNELTKPQHSTILLIGLVVISFLVGFVLAYELYYCCTWQGVKYCPCKSNLDGLSEAIEQLKATDGQLNATDGQLKTIHEQLKEVIGKLGG
jgi:hypothetical protein